MRMIRLVIRSGHPNSPTLPEPPKPYVRTMGSWELAHLRTPDDESDDDIHNDVIHGVINGDTNSERV
jgi:hypothetical protein